MAHTPDPYRQFPQTTISSLLSDFDARMSKRMPHFQVFDAAYESRWWSHRRKDGQDSRLVDASEDGMSVVEVQRAYGYIQGYVGSLFNDRVRLSFKDDVEGRGSPMKAEVLSNQWFRAKRTSKRFIQAIEQALLYDGSGVKMGVSDDPRRKGLSRVWLRVVPWWELVTDYNVVDLEDQRFIGHLYWMPLAQARRKYKDPTIVGSTRPDPLSSSTKAAARPSRGLRKGSTPGDDESIDDKFVRVFEFYNFVDDYVFGESNLLTGQPYKDWKPECDEENRPKPPIPGRYEVYLPDQKTGGSVPVKVLPMPYADADGVPVAPLKSLVLTGSPKQPLHGLSALGRVIDQIRELNISRSFKSNATKRNSRMVVVEEGVFDSTAKEAFRSGKDGIMLEGKKSADGSFNPMSAMAPVTLGALPADNYRYDEEIERDLANGTNQGAFTRGQSSGGDSATEIKVRNAYSQTEVGHMGLSRDLVFEEMAVLLLRMFIQIMRADNEPMTVMYRRKRMTITAEDIDADFEIKVTPGATTPMAEDRERQTFLAILPVLTPLLDKASKGDPIASLLLDEMVAKYDLDEKFLTENIKRLVEAEPSPPGTEPTKVKALPGAGSALPGAGSASLPANEMGLPEKADGSPQPQPAGEGAMMA